MQDPLLNSRARLIFVDGQRMKSLRPFGVDDDGGNGGDGGDGGGECCEYSSSAWAPVARLLTLGH